MREAKNGAVIITRHDKLSEADLSARNEALNRLARSVLDKKQNDVVSGE